MRNINNKDATLTDTKGAELNLSLSIVVYADPPITSGSMYWEL